MPELHACQATPRRRWRDGWSAVSTSCRWRGRRTRRVSTRGAGGSRAPRDRRSRLGDEPAQWSRPSSTGWPGRRRTPPGQRRGVRRPGEEAATTSAPTSGRSTSMTSTASASVRAAVRPARSEAHMPSAQSAATRWPGRRGAGGGARRRPHPAPPCGRHRASASHRPRGPARGAVVVVQQRHAARRAGDRHRRRGGGRRSWPHRRGAPGRPQDRVATVSSTAASVSACRSWRRGGITR